MGINDPSELTASCDMCDEDETFDTTEYCGEMFGVDDTTLEEKRWGRRDGMVLCPDCLQGEQE